MSRRPDGRHRSSPRGCRRSPRAASAVRGSRRRGAGGAGARRYRAARPWCRSHGSARGPSAWHGPGCRRGPSSPRPRHDGWHRRGRRASVPVPRNARATPIRATTTATNAMIPATRPSRDRMTTALARTVTATTRKTIPNRQPNPRRGPPRQPRQPRPDPAGPQPPGAGPFGPQPPSRRRDSQYARRRSQRSRSPPSAGGHGRASPRSSPRSSASR